MVKIKTILKFAGILMFFVVFACRNSESIPKEKPVARVQNKYLYPSDLRKVLSDNMAPADSETVVRDFIEKWVHRQLLLNKAEMNLSDDQKNVDSQIEDYRTSLLIFKYEQSLISQKLDTVVSDQEIEKYYNSNTRNFVLNDNLVKALFIQVPREAPEIYRLRSWYKSDDETNLARMEAYCYQYATKYDYFNDNWVYFSEIEKALPNKIYNPQNQLQYRKYFESQDSLYYYFLKIKEYQLTSMPAPLSFVKSDIKSIILNKRKIQLIKQVESNVYNDALNRGYFNIY
ncbi:MAG: hypothetical protein JXJ22_01100 [Bacteroidales bacterium]|nr:hypothetical protein [Bacteroidales bacterium]